MDNKNSMHPNPPDVDVAPSAPPSYEYNANYHQQQPASCSPSASSYQHHSSMMMPSAPPSIPPSQQHFTYGSVQPQPSLCHPYALYQQQHQHQQSYQEPSQRYRYIISSRDRGDRHFPVNAALFVLGWYASMICTV